MSNTINYGDPMEVLALTSSKLHEKNEASKMAARAMFEAGCAMGKREFSGNEGGMSTREMFRIVGVSNPDAKFAMQIAKKFNYDPEQFDKAWDDSGAKTWSTFVNRHANKSRVHVNDHLLDSLWEKVKKVLNSIQCEDKNHSYYHSIKKLRNRINKHIPMDDTVFDRETLRYSQCCGCGAKPEPEGHRLIVHAKYPYMQYPLCEECADIDVQPNMEMVAVIYAVYSINLEQTMDIIHDDNRI